MIRERLLYRVNHAIGTGYNKISRIWQQIEKNCKEKSWMVW